MLSKIKDIVLVGKYRSPELTSFVQEIANYLSSLHCNVFIEAETLQYMPINYPVAQYDQSYDLIIAIGGDGTMMGAVRSWLFHGIPLLGINKGRIGFLTDINETNVFEELRSIINGNYSSENRDILSCEIKRNDELIAQHIAINDIIIMGHRPYNYSLFIDDEFAINQYTTGFVISTATGSTAYAANAGGSIIHPNAGVLNIVPICSQSLGIRPLIVSSQQKIKINFTGHHKATYNTDGIDGCDISSDCDFHMTMHDKKFTLIHPSKYSYFENLRNKLKWG